MFTEGYHVTLPYVATVYSYNAEFDAKSSKTVAFVHAHLLISYWINFQQTHNNNK